MSHSLLLFLLLAFKLMHLLPQLLAVLHVHVVLLLQSLVLYFERDVHPLRQLLLQHTLVLSGLFQLLLSRLQFSSELLLSRKRSLMLCTQLLNLVFSLQLLLLILGHTRKCLLLF